MAVGEAERDVTTRFAESLRASGIEVPTVGVGSTPTCSVPPPHLAGVDEWHPGNFLYYDTSQAHTLLSPAHLGSPRLTSAHLGSPGSPRLTSALPARPGP